MARLEKLVGDVRVVISESVKQRVWKEELTIRDFNGRNLEPIEFEVNHEHGDCRGWPHKDCWCSQCDLLDSSHVIFALVNTQQREVGEQEFDTRISARPTKCDLNNIVSICRANAHMVYGLKHQHFTPHSNTTIHS